MKTPIAVTLIIMGALLVMTPAFSDSFYQHSLAVLMSRPGVTGANLDGKMGDLYRLGSWLTGSAMIAIAVLTSLARTTASAEHASLATQSA